MTCEHKCHKVGLNPWVEECPICGCPNPEYDPEAKCDIEPVETELDRALNRIFN